MKELTVTDPVPFCELGTVVLEELPVSLSLKAPDCTQERFEFRCFWPQLVDRRPFLEDLIARLMNDFGQSAGEEQEFYCWIISMLWFRHFSPDLDERRTRRFNIRSFHTSETLQSMAKMTRTDRLPAVDRLERIADDTTRPTIKLLMEAIFKGPDITIPLSPEHYVAFRNHVLSEMQRAMLMLEGWKQKELTELQRRLESKSNMKAGEQAKLRAKLKSLETGEDQSFVERVCEPSIGYLLEQSLKREEAFSCRFQDLVEKAKGLQESVFKEVKERDIEMLLDDEETFTPEYADCIARNFDVRGADALLEDVILRYEEVGRIPSKKAVEDTTDEIVQFSGGLPFDPGHYLALVRTREKGDTFDKWNALGWVTTDLVNRNECVRLLCREAEAVWLGVLECGFKQVYRKIQHRLTAPERRAFALLYFRQTVFDYRIAALDPVIMSFFTGMDEETQAMAILVLVLKQEGWDGIKDFRRKLETRWRRYLHFYPSWLELIRSDERESKQAQVSSEVNISFETAFVENKKGKKLKIEAVLQDPHFDPENLLQALTLEEYGTVREWTEKYCTPTQARYVEKYACERKSVLEIAAEEGKTHQAVSKVIRTARKRIEEGLRSRFGPEEIG